MSSLRLVRPGTFCLRFSLIVFACLFCEHAHNSHILHFEWILKFDLLFVDCLPAWLLRTQTPFYFFIYLKSWWRKKRGKLIKWIWNNWTVDEMTIEKNQEANSEKNREECSISILLSTERKNITPQATKSQQKRLDKCNYTLVLRF